MSFNSVHLKIPFARDKQMRVWESFINLNLGRHSPISAPLCTSSAALIRIPTRQYPQRDQRAFFSWPARDSSIASEGYSVNLTSSSSYSDKFTWVHFYFLLPGFKKRCKLQLVGGKANIYCKTNMGIRESMEPMAPCHSPHHQRCNRWHQVAWTQPIAASGDPPVSHEGLDRGQDPKLQSCGKKTLLGTSTYPLKKREGLSSKHHFSGANC